MCVCVRACVCACVCVCMCMYACVYVGVWACGRVGVWACVYVCEGNSAWVFMKIFYCCSVSNVIMIMTFDKLIYVLN